MRPEVRSILGQISGTLLTDLAPLVPIDYLQKNTAVISVILMCAAEEWDRAADRRVKENREIRSLFKEAAPRVLDAQLAKRLEEASGEMEASLNVSVLDRTNDELRSLLVELQAYAEDLNSSEGRQIEAAIWRELRTSTERRTLSMAPF
jgi:hypothetical protein